MSFLKNILLHFLYAVRTIVDRVFPLQEVSVLVYHAIADDERDISLGAAMFESHLLLIRTWGYEIVSLEDVVHWVKGEHELPKKSVAITLDDGYADNATALLPILERHHVPVTIFTVEGGMIPGVDHARFPLLDEEQKELLRGSGLVQIESHSYSHQMLDTIPPDELQHAIERGDFRFLAYPGGHVSESVWKAVEQEGYDAAFSTKPGLLHPGDHLFTLRRNAIVRSMKLFDLRVRVSYAMHWYGRLTVFLKKYHGHIPQR